MERMTVAARLTLLPPPDDDTAFCCRGAAAVVRPRPDSFSRCTLPMTALRVTEPSWAAIRLALRPSDHNFLRSSTRSSVQFMARALQWTVRNPESIGIPALPGSTPHIRLGLGLPHEI